MAFNRDYFNLIGPGAGRGPRQWTYISTDLIATVDDADYFIDVAGEVRAGDRIHVVRVATGTVDNPTTVTTVTDLVVLTAVGPKDGGTVTVTTFPNALSLT